VFELLSILLAHGTSHHPKDVGYMFDNVGYMFFSTDDFATLNTTDMHINSDFDGGNIELVAMDSPQNIQRNIQLNIQKDNNADFRQVFYFQALGVKGLDCTFRIMNAWQVAYPEAWPGTTVLVSYDGQDWFRIPTTFNKKELEFSLSPKHDSVFLSLFVPYSLERHQATINHSLKSGRCRLQGIGESVEGRDVEILALGDPVPQKPKIWIIARQHPAEAMAEWYAEGLLDRLCTGSDPTTLALLEQAEFYIVSNINPDGSFHGNIRTNAAGVDLNRAWDKTSSEKIPEVHFVLGQMNEIGVDFFMDVHGEEVTEFVFPCGCEGNPGYTPKIEALETKFYREYQAANPEFQWDYRYPMEEPGTANLSIANNHVGQRFDCLSLAIEMPFKDNVNAPDPRRGWSTERSMKLGASLLEPLLAVLKELRYTS